MVRIVTGNAGRKSPGESRRIGRQGSACKSAYAFSEQGSPFSFGMKALSACLASVIRFVSVFRSDSADARQLSLVVQNPWPCRDVQTLAVEVKGRDRQFCVFFFCCGIGQSLTVS